MQQTIHIAFILWNDFYQLSWYKITYGNSYNYEYQLFIWVCKWLLNFYYEENEKQQVGVACQTVVYCQVIPPADEEK